jgi:hypothetical protein
MGEEAEYAQTIVDRYQDYALLGEHFSIGARSRAGSACISARVDPHHYRPTIGRRLGGGPDIQIKAVLTTCDAAFGFVSASPATSALRT